jgi:hypothetical protein
MTSTVAVTDTLIDKHLERMDDVVAEYLKGSSVTEISRTLNLSQSQVGMVLKEWRGLASNNEAMKERAVLALRGADLHYNKLIHKAYSVLSDAENSNSIPQRLSSIKLIADIEKVRIDLLQKAGMLEDANLSSEMIETQRRQDILMDILKNTVGPCPRCRGIVQEKLSEISNETVILKA